MTTSTRKAPLAVKRIYEKIIVVTRPTQLDELVARFNTKAQAKFYLEHAGESFDPIESAHERYHAVLNGIQEAIPRETKNQFLDRGLLPQYTFGEADLIVVVGQDGLVVNTAKYLNGQPILAVNPDPARIDGVLLPFEPKDFSKALRVEGRVDRISMAKATLNDGQTLLAVNDLFVGVRSHVSARYRISIGGKIEEQSSSGLIVSTGAGSTGWMKSVLAGAAGVIRGFGGRVTLPKEDGRFPWNAEYLVYAVREPFPSKSTQASLVFGMITPDAPLVISSAMASNGAIFSDGIESDYLQFNAGAIATITIADRKVNLIRS